jgi:anti-sigma factor RsiW
MNKPENIEDRLWEYIDGAGSAEDRLFIEQLIASNAEWKAKYQELLELQDLLSHRLELDEPSMRFTRNVMEAISKHHIAAAAKSYINKRIVWGIAGFFICTIIGFLIAAFAQLHWTRASTTDSSIINFNKLNLDKVDTSKLFNSTYATIFMMVNVVLGLVVLDMFLGRKKAKAANR